MPPGRKTLFAFVDPKDPFVAGEVAEEDLPGPILSLAEARRFDALVLFHTPQTRKNAEATCAEIASRFPECKVSVTELPVSDPKDYSALMGTLARHVRQCVRSQTDSENYVCISSGTAEMRAAWFVLAASGALAARLLQLGTPREPLFGAANVRELDLSSADWLELRDLILPRTYWWRTPAPEVEYERSEHVLMLEERLARPSFLKVEQRALPSPPRPELDQALQELGIFIGSAVMREAAERAAIAAGTDCPVLLTGETGTGKEMFATLIHRLSARNGRPMAPVNCAAIPKDLAESYLFGHERGAFTGAVASRRGIFEEADGGTLFLDEIGELPVEMQAKLLRVLQDGVTQRVGSNQPRKVNVRILAATNKNLPAEIQAGRFREDLYYRLEVVHIELPPLRKRPAEIPTLAAAVLHRINQRRRVPRQLSKEAMRRLEQHDWPGNVRELINVLERSVLFSRSEVLGPDDLIIRPPAGAPDPLALLPEPAPGFSLEAFLAQVRKQLLLRALEKTNGNQSQAAELLGISRQAVNAFLRGAGVKPN